MLLKAETRHQIATKPNIPRPRNIITAEGLIAVKNGSFFKISNNSKTFFSPENDRCRSVSATGDTSLLLLGCTCVTEKKEPCCASTTGFRFPFSLASVLEAFDL
ncbi:MAG: hypothetical protein RL156_1456 [Bacteroidota bacterium]|jgi:hypothetical protein